MIAPCDRDPLVASDGGMFSFGNAKFFGSTGQTALVMPRRRNGRQHLSLQGSRHRQGGYCREVHVSDIRTVFDGLPFLQDAELGCLNGHPLRARRLDGPQQAPGWEMHPDTDELFHVMDGHMEVVIMTAEGPERFDLPAGSVFVIPKGHWHQPAIHGPTSLIFLTPGTTEWTDAEDAPPPAV